MVLNQHVVLVHADTITDEFDFSVGRQDFFYENSFRVCTLEVYLNEVGIIHGTKGELFILEGYGGCNECKEYTCLIDTSGRVQYSLLRDKSEVYATQGDFNTVLNHIGYPVLQYRAGKYPHVLVPN